ncbi:hypothetical protein CGW93_01800 [candidate division bacterium WOR-3 4484_18]|uniref:Sodium:solute symporter n=1 Tax=candidate division WOR-3 bacterium 4484_18 TaxID=2020626 RepID=A0A257LU91_UNCW3|nr:MAG: hypothetical protein CGW93_01800 [candidate division bacterium WOR-3 4484_18]
MPWGAVCLSILATEASALTFIGVPADAYRANYTYLQFAFGSFVGRFLIAYLLMPAFYRGKVITVYQYLYQRFGTATRNTATLLFFVTRLLASGVRLLAAVGGIKAVIWTDVMQAIVFLGGAWLVIYYLLSHIPGSWQTVTTIAGKLGKLRVFDLRPALSNPRWLVVGVVNGCFQTFAALGTDQDLTQRMLTCRRVRDSQHAIIMTGIIDFPVVITFLTIGTLLYVFYQRFPDPGLPTNTDHIFPYFIVTQLPVGMRGLLIAGVFAAAMSSIDSALGALASSAIVDIYQPYIKKRASERHYLMVSRITVLLFCLILIGIAIVCRNVEQILWLGFKIGAFTYGALLGVFLLGVLVKRGSDLGNVVAMLSSIVVILILFVSQQRIGVAWPWLVVIGAVWTFAVGLLFKSKHRVTHNA